MEGASATAGAALPGDGEIGISGQIETAEIAAEIIIDGDQKFP